MTITRILRKNDIRFHKERIDMRESFDVEAIRVDYENQMTIKDICTKYDISNNNCNLFI